MARTVTVDSAGAKMGIYERQPKGSPKGAVIVVQEAFGITQHIQDVCARFAAEGYLAAAPHLFHRTGDPIIPYDDMQKVIPHVMGLKVENLEADLDATLKHLATGGLNAKQIAIVGFCMGGSIALLEASRAAIGASVTFYGGGITQGRFGMKPLNELAKSLKTPWLGLFGDQDQSIPLTEVEVLRKTAARSEVPTHIVRYPDADHGFHCDARPSYHEASAKDAWQRTLKWIESHLQAH